MGPAERGFGPEAAATRQVGLDLRGGWLVYGFRPYPVVVFESLKPLAFPLPLPVCGR